MNRRQDRRGYLFSESKGYREYFTKCRIYLYTIILQRWVHKNEIIIVTISVRGSPLTQIFNTNTLKHCQHTKQSTENARSVRGMNNYCAYI